MAQASARRCGTGESCVQVEVYGAGATPTQTALFSSTQLAAFPDQESGDYEVRPGPGSDRDGPGVPIRELMQQAGVTPASVTYAYVIGSTAYRSPLSASTRDFDPPTSNGFKDGLQPLFYQVGDSLGYVRALRANDLDDTNAADFMQVTRGGAFIVQVHTSGALLHPTLRASAATVRVGAPVRLSATVSDPISGESLDWKWSFADGGRDVDTGATPTVTHSYAAPGTYYAQVSVAGASGSSGESATVPITVKSQAKVPKPPKTTGPGRGLGTSSNPVGGPVTGAGSRYNGRPGAPRTATGGPGSPTAARPGSDSTSTSPTAGPSSPEVSTATSPLERPSGGQLVAGFALIDPAGVTPNQRDTAAPAAAAAARAGGTHVRASLAWVGLACILALLLAGAGLERRRALPGPLYGRKRWRHR